MIIGSGPQQDQLQKLVNKLNIRQQVKFSGSKTALQLSKLFGQAKLGIFMSPYESFGLTAVECLACQTPIIGVDTNGIGEIIRAHNPSYLTANNPQALCKKLQNFKDFKNVTPLKKEYFIKTQIQKLSDFFKNISWLLSSQFSIYYFLVSY